MQILLFSLLLKLFLDQICHLLKNFLGAWRKAAQRRFLLLVIKFLLSLTLFRFCFISAFVFSLLWIFKSLLDLLTQYRFDLILELVLLIILLYRISIFRMSLFLNLWVIFKVLFRIISMTPFPSGHVLSLLIIIKQFILKSYVPFVGISSLACVVIAMSEIKIWTKIIIKVVIVIILVAISAISDYSVPLIILDFFSWARWAFATCLILSIVQTALLQTIFETKCSFIVWPWHAVLWPATSNLRALLRILIAVDHVNRVITVLVMLIRSLILHYLFLLLLSSSRSSYH